MTDRHASVEAGGASESFQSRVQAQLHHICDGAGDPSDLPERRDRFGEEAMEFFQALGGTEEAAHALVRYVFSRPIGEPAQELGGTMTTLAGAAAYAGLEMVECGERELARTWQPELVAKIRRKRSNRHGRGPLPGNDADLVSSALAPAAGPVAESVLEEVRRAVVPTIERAEELAAWMTLLLADSSWHPNRSNFEAARNAIRETAKAGRTLLTTPTPSVSPVSTPAGAGVVETVEAVARAIFEADEDINDETEARLRREGNTRAADCLAGPRARWDDPKNAPILHAFRTRAHAAIRAYEAALIAAHQPATLTTEAKP